MQKNLFHRADFRFSLFLFLGLLFTLSGCNGSKTPPPPGNDTVPVKGATTVTPYVEPMVPQTQPEEKKAEEPKKEETSMMKSATFGKIAQQSVPLPPVADLVAQADEYLDKIGGWLKDLDGTSDYKKDADAVVRDTNGLALIALAIGLSPEDSKYKKAAPGIIAAALALEKVGKLDAANKAYADLKAAYESSGDPTTLGWTKIASLGPVMKAVPNLDATAKRLSNSESKLKRVKTNSIKVTAPFAGLAAIAQGSIANVKETLKPEAEAEWKKECEQFRDAAIKANAAVHAFVKEEATYADFEAAYTALSETCESCHKIFQPNMK
jgi:hypothetical protein